MFQHDLEHTGETSDVIENPEDLELKWKFKVGVIGSSPVVSGNYVYASSVGGEDSLSLNEGHVYCLNKDTGELIWKFKAGSCPSFIDLKEKM